MGRLISSQKSSITARGEDKEKTTPQQDYFERVGKYIPGEIIAGYVAMLSFLDMSSENLRFGISIGVFILCLALTPFYFKMMATKKDKEEGKNKIRLHQIISSIAFVIWAYAIGGNGGLFGTEGLNWYDAGLGSILLVAFTLVSGVIVPPSNPET